MEERFYITYSPTDRIQSHAPNLTAKDSEKYSLCAAKEVKVLCIFSAPDPAQSPGFRIFFDTQYFPVNTIK